MNKCTGLMMNSNKPKPVKNLVIIKAHESTEKIDFWVDGHLAYLFAEFGNVRRIEEDHSYNSKNRFCLQVDSRYDFQEILGYMRELEDNELFNQLKNSGFVRYKEV